MILPASSSTGSVIANHNGPETEHVIHAIASAGEWLRGLDYRFAAVTPSTHARVLDREPRAKDLRDVFGWNRTFSRSLLPEEIFTVLEKAGLLGRTDQRWRSLVRFATVDNGIYAHSAYPTDNVDSVFFGPDSYRFVSALRRHVTSCERLLDVGCGTGVGGLALHDRARHIMLSDINPRALVFTAANARLAGVESKVSLHCADLLAGLTERPDVIIANPPYLVDVRQRTYRDGGGDRGLALSQRVVAESIDILPPGGKLLLYTGTPVIAGEDEFRHRIAPLLATAELEVIYEELDPDVFGEELAGSAYADAERIAVVLLRMTRRGIRSLRLHEPAGNGSAAFHRRLGQHLHARLAPARPGAEMEADPDDAAACKDFLDTERKAAAGAAASAPADADGFVRWFQDLEAHGPGQHDPLFAWLATCANLEQMRWFISQELAGEAGFDDLVALTQVQMPARAKLEMARNLWDEFGRGNPRAVHASLLADTAAGLGVAADPQTSLWQPLALANLMAGMALERSFAYHSVGALGAVELTAPGRVAQVAAGLRRLGVGAATRRYFDLHARLDVAHAQAWSKEVLASLVANDFSLARPLAEGALMRLEAGRRCFAAYRTHFGLPG